MAKSKAGSGAKAFDRDVAKEAKRQSAKKKALRRLTVWSPTNLQLYESCPRKAQYKLLDKLPDDGDRAPLERGITIHNAAANYITGRKKDPLHEDLKGSNIKRLIESLKKGWKARSVRVELDLAFTREWKVTQWFGADAWLRLKVDVLHLLGNGNGRVIDWKTGKLREEKIETEYDPQLNLYAVAGLTSGLVTKEVTSALAFTDADKIVERPAGTLKRSQLPKAQAAWEQKTKAMLSDTTFAPRPGNACTWCPYSCNKGGPCEF